MRSIHRTPLGALLLVLTTANAVVGQEAAGWVGDETAARPGPAAPHPEPDRLHLPELYELARARSPRLRAARAAVDASRAREASAGLPPDPMLEVGAMNVSLPGLATDMPTSMAPSLQAMQTIPFPGKLRLSGEVARHATRAEAAWAEEAWWEVRARVARAFYDLYAIDRALATMGETLDLLRSIESVARSRYATGSGTQADVLRASVEVARTRAEITRLEAARAGAAARLNALLDRPATTPVPSPTLPPLPLDPPSVDTLRNWAEASRPLLQAQRILVEQAGTRRALARREIWPDFTIGVQYGRSRARNGTEWMGSAMIGFTVPIFARRRQLEMREEAAAIEAASEATLAERRAEIAARILELTASLAQLSALIDLYRHEILPQAAANVASAFAAYRAGTVDFLTVIDAWTAHKDFERELHTLVAEYGATVAELETTVGRELPATGDPLAEAP